NASDIDGTDLHWFKPAALPKQTIYPDGWPNGITVDFAGSKYIQPGNATSANPNTVIGAGVPKASSKTVANLTVTLDAGDLPAPGTTTDDASLFTSSAVAVLA